MTIQNAQTRGGSAPIDLVEKPYRYKKRADWTPESVGPIGNGAPPAGHGRSAKRDDMLAREARFAGARDEGKTIAEAGALINVALVTARAYELRRTGGRLPVAPPTPAQERSARLRAEFGAMRQAGMTFDQAWRALGVTRKTAKRYEELRLAALEAGGSS